MDINGKKLEHGIIQGGMGVGASLSELACYECHAYSKDSGDHTLR